MCQHHFQPRENELCHVLCSSCPYFELGAARTVPNSQVIVFCSTPLVCSQFGVLRTVNGAAPWCSQNSSEQSCDRVLFHSISVLKIRSTPNSKWSSPQNSSEQSCDRVLFHSISVLKIRSTPNSKWSSP